MLCKELRRYSWCNRQLLNYRLKSRVEALRLAECEQYVSSGWSSAHVDDCMRHSVFTRPGVREESRRQFVCEKCGRADLESATRVSHSSDELFESIAIFFAHKVRGEFLLSDGGGQVVHRMLPYR